MHQGNLVEQVLKAHYYPKFIFYGSQVGHLSKIYMEGYLGGSMGAKKRDEMEGG